MLPPPKHPRLSGQPSAIAAPSPGHPVPPPPRCAAADLAQVSAGVAAVASVYLCNHPDVTSLGGLFAGRHRSSPRAGAWRRTRSLALGALSGHPTGVRSPTGGPPLARWAGDRLGTSGLEERVLVMVAVMAVPPLVEVVLDDARRLPHGRNRAGDRHLNFQHYRDNIRCRRTSGTGAEIRQPEIAMLAHADKRTAAPSIQDLVNNRAHANPHLLRRRKKCRL
jgi:hypothetical protein